MAKRPTPERKGALFVRIPAAVADRLDRAAGALGIHKKDLVAALVTKYVDPDSTRGRKKLEALSTRRVTVELDRNGPTLGSYSFQPYDPPEVMNAQQAAELLQVDEKVVIELAESGTLPGKKIGNVWRFSRAAVIAWLSKPQR